MRPSRLAFAQSVPMTLELVSRAIGTGTMTDSLTCPDCQEPLNLHQPDENEPTQLLGTCDCCSRWFFLVESELERAGTLMFELPSAAAIRAMFADPATRH